MDQRPSSGATAFMEQSLNMTSPDNVADEVAGDDASLLELERGSTTEGGLVRGSKSKLTARERWRMAAKSVIANNRLLSAAGRGGSSREGQSRKKVDPVEAKELKALFGKDKGDVPYSGLMAAMPSFFGPEWIDATAKLKEKGVRRTLVEEPQASENLGEVTNAATIIEAVQSVRKGFRTLSVKPLHIIAESTEKVAQGRWVVQAKAFSRYVGKQQENFVKDALENALKNAGNAEGETICPEFGFYAGTDLAPNSGCKTVAQVLQGVNEGINKFAHTLATPVAQLEEDLKQVEDALELLEKKMKVPLDDLGTRAKKHTKDAWIGYGAARAFLRASLRMWNAERFTKTKYMAEQTTKSNVANPGGAADGADGRGGATAHGQQSGLETINSEKMSYLTQERDAFISSGTQVITEVKACLTIAKTMCEWLKEVEKMLGDVNAQIAIVKSQKADIEQKIKRRKEMDQLEKQEGDEAQRRKEELEKEGKERDRIKALKEKKLADIASLQQSCNEAKTKLEDHRGTDEKPGTRKYGHETCTAVHRGESRKVAQAIKELEAWTVGDAGLVSDEPRFGQDELKRAKDTCHQAEAVAKKLEEKLREYSQKRILAVFALQQMNKYVAVEGDTLKASHKGMDASFQRFFAFVSAAKKEPPAKEQAVNKLYSSEDAKDAKAKDVERDRFRILRKIAERAQERNLPREQDRPHLHQTSKCMQSYTDTLTKIVDGISVRTEEEAAQDRELSSALEDEPLNAYSLCAIHSFSKVMWRGAKRQDLDNDAYFSALMGIPLESGKAAIKLDTERTEDETQAINWHKTKQESEDLFRDRLKFSTFAHLRYALAVTAMVWSLLRDTLANVRDMAVKTAESCIKHRPFYTNLEMNSESDSPGKYLKLITKTSPSPPFCPKGEDRGKELYTAAGSDATKQGLRFLLSDKEFKELAMCTDGFCSSVRKKLKDERGERDDLRYFLPIQLPMQKCLADVLTLKGQYDTLMRMLENWRHELPTITYFDGNIEPGRPVSGSMSDIVYIRRNMDLSEKVLWSGLSDKENVMKQDLTTKCVKQNQEWGGFGLFNMNSAFSEVVPERVCKTDARGPLAQLGVQPMVETIQSMLSEVVVGFERDAQQRVSEVIPNALRKWPLTSEAFTTHAKAQVDTAKMQCKIGGQDPVAKLNKELKMTAKKLEEKCATDPGAANLEEEAEALKGAAKLFREEARALYDHKLLETSTNAWDSYGGLVAYSHATLNAIEAGAMFSKQQQDTRNAAQPKTFAKEMGLAWEEISPQLKANIKSTKSFAEQTCKQRESVSQCIAELEREQIIERMENVIEQVRKYEDEQKKLKEAADAKEADRQKVEADKRAKLHAAKRFCDKQKRDWGKHVQKLDSILQTISDQLEMIPRPGEEIPWKEKSPTFDRTKPETILEANDEVFNNVVKFKNEEQDVLNAIAILKLYANNWIKPGKAGRNLAENTVSKSYEALKIIQNAVAQSRELADAKAADPAVECDLNESEAFGKAGDALIRLRLVWGMKQDADRMVVIDKAEAEEEADSVLAKWNYKGKGKGKELIIAAAKARLAFDTARSSSRDVARKRVEYSEHIAKIYQIATDIYNQLWTVERKILEGELRRLGLSLDDSPKGDAGVLREVKWPYLEDRSELKESARNLGKRIEKLPNAPDWWKKGHENAWNYDEGVFQVSRDAAELEYAHINERGEDVEEQAKRGEQAFWSAPWVMAKNEAWRPDRFGETMKKLAVGKACMETVMRMADRGRIAWDIQFGGNFNDKEKRHYRVQLWKETGSVARHTWTRWNHLHNKQAEAEGVWPCDGTVTTGGNVHDVGYLGGDACVDRLMAVGPSVPNFVCNTQGGESRSKEGYQSFRSGDAPQGKKAPWMYQNHKSGNFISLTNFKVPKPRPRGKKKSKGS
ncbi:unnamed protein product [Amoebophrya sp. A25]|nr:unnamed protein product [Amoebophrya sp. A25]|eukprot:GSA25T00001691001.1